MGLRSGPLTAIELCAPDAFPAQSAKTILSSFQNKTVRFVQQGPTSGSNVCPGLLFIVMIKHSKIF